MRTQAGGARGRSAGGWRGRASDLCRFQTEMKMSAPAGRWKPASVSGPSARRMSTGGCGYRRMASLITRVVSRSAFTCSTPGRPSPTTASTCARRRLGTGGRLHDGGPSRPPAAPSLHASARVLDLPRPCTQPGTGRGAAHAPHGRAGVLGGCAAQGRPGRQRPRSGRGGGGARGGGVGGRAPRPAGAQPRPGGWPGSAASTSARPQWSRARRSAWSSGRRAAAC